MEIKQYNNVNVTYIPFSGVLQIWSSEDENEQISLFHVREEG